MGTNVWLVLTGFMSGAANAVAGGGTFLAFPVLIGVAGLSTVAANVTCTIGLLPGMIASTGGYFGDLFAQLRRDARRQLVPSALGGILGAWLLLELGERVFAQVIPWLLIVSAALIACQPLIARWLLKHRPEHGYAWASIVVPFAVSVYGGYFGAGQGIAFVAAMGLLLPRSMGELNALRILSAMVNTVVAAVTFIALEAHRPTGALDLRAALPVGLGSLLGGWAGVHVARRLPAGVLRGVLATVGFAIGVYLAVRR
ncbi:MAG TPA: sulfite exporter TauE/SafE family protein [Myxococcales bacterium]|nr:sulfite exporter TauE/SafE family protein [Myxococcales bacterium]